ncbi:hypothetical protein Q4601_11975 [Shewanella sp. 1_MG-2023]|uniref:hypothetical protein n=1 Tax=unclassified Shewanella TaxID=196818 RepID=UPI0026E30F90|nr:MULTISPECIES: hypothetical protein [unclassified Shewanella]MDO6610518.1 hypothetical protein [Shewanella sp. 7_MG-2023]MDO6770643.1 hypothetical protein [Shewanella sp. 2_MG-2023]MDO6795029.1 hypothetical protein [Shewanella sp. 1_MG-2023]
MNDSVMLSLEDRFSGIKRWKSGKKVALHKPLLILYVLNQYKYNHRRLFNFEYDICEQLGSLLQLFGSGNKIQNPHYPFWRLKNDSLWEVKLQGSIKLTSSGDASKKQLCETKAEGGFIEPIYNKLINNKSAIDILSQLIVKVYFPKALQPALTEFFEIKVISVAKGLHEETTITQYDCNLIDELISEFEF